MHILVDNEYKKSFNPLDCERKSSSQLLQLLINIPDRHIWFFAMKANFALHLAGVLANSLAVAAAPAHLTGPARSSAAGTSVVTNTHWSGAVYNGQGVTNIEASFVIPNISGQSSEDSVAVWVGIDGATSGHCGNTLMQAGILLYGDGSIRRKWFEPSRA